jgi:hypothetical protein
MENNGKNGMKVNSLNWAREGRGNAIPFIMIFNLGKLNGSSQRGGSEKKRLGACFYCIYDTR